MFSIDRMLARREIDAWRDRWTETACLILNDAAESIIAALEAEIAALPLSKALLAPGAYRNGRVAPLMQQWAEPIVAKLFDEARADLHDIIAHNPVLHVTASTSQGADDNGGWLDVASATAPLAVAGAVVAATSTLAVTSTTALFGLVTVTAISWPVVIGGATIAGAAALLGGFSVARLPDTLRGRLATQMRRDVKATLLHGTKGHVSILRQIATELEKAAEQAKRL